MDREKVIKAVEEAFDLVHSDFIGTDDFNETEWEQNKTDALALLKKQVPMEPKEMKIAKYHYQCAICESYVGTKDLTVNRFNKKYCAECGQAVKWE